MKAILKSDILGFANVKEVEVQKVDELFSILKSTEDHNISFTLVNPYMLREYSFDLPRVTQILLEITPESKTEVYCIAVMQNPLDESKVNFLAPIVFNTENNTAAQIVLKEREYPDFGLAEELKDFIVSE